MNTFIIDESRRNVIKRIKYNCYYSTPQLRSALTHFNDP